jgi:hypothetical protein
MNVETDTHQLRFVAIKCSLSAISWKPEYRENLQNLVVTVNDLTTHTYLFSRLLFTRELHYDRNFPLPDYVTREFFAEIFLSLARRRQLTRNSLQTSQYRDLIMSCLPYYCMVSGYRPIVLPQATQIAFYQGTAVATCYLNTTMNGFGQQLRRIVNRLLDVKLKASDRRAELREQGHGETVINDMVAKEIYESSRDFKLAISRRPINLSAIPANMRNVYDKLEPIFKSYPDDYRFQYSSIYYDAKARPENHLSAYSTIW